LTFNDIEGEHYGATGVRISAIYIIELAAIAFIYFWLVKLGLALASINPSASPVWPPTGFALAILLLRGYGVWPAIFVGAFLANVSNAGQSTRQRPSPSAIASKAS
jgi:integral membrane sensor domain MASE1